MPKIPAPARRTRSWRLTTAGTANDAPTARSPRKPTSIRRVGDADFLAEETDPGRRPFLVALGVLMVFVFGVAALTISLALDIRPSVSNRPSLGRSVVVPAKPAPPPAPAPAAPAIAPAAPRPAPAAPPLPAAPPAMLPQLPAPRLPIPGPGPLAPGPPPGPPGLAPCRAFRTALVRASRASLMAAVGFRTFRVSGASTCERAR